MPSDNKLWILWRQDDNGASVTIDRYPSEAEANAAMAELEARAHKQHYWIEREMSTTPQLNLVVLRSSDLEASRSFYEAIGLQFEKHQHGRGQEHYASESDDLVFEIYPEGDALTK